MNSIKFYQTHCKLASKQIRLALQGYSPLMHEYRVTYWISMLGVSQRTMVTIITSALNKIQAYDNIKLLESDSGTGYKTKLISVEKI